MIPRLLQIAGLVIIISSIFLGLNSYEITDEYGEIEKSLTVLFSWIGIGAVSGLLLIGIGEIVHKLDEISKKP